MNLSISNIAWPEEYDDYIYKYIQKNNFKGVEIAPTRIFANDPYSKLIEAQIFSNKILDEYNLIISSIQSIWFGKTENIFSSVAEREILFEYTKKAIDFASVMKCKNLVFGCPKNRNITNDSDLEIAIEFFRELGNYAISKNTIIAIEPNPTIYETNFINTTNQAFDLVNIVDSKGVMVNLDFGTIIQNYESMENIYKNINFVNHIHISEPFLNKIEQRDIHKTLSTFLKSSKYNKFVSIEMKNLNNINFVKSAIKYVGGLFFDI